MGSEWDQFPVVGSGVATAPSPAAPEAPDVAGALPADPWAAFPLADPPPATRPAKAALWDDFPVMGQADPSTSSGQADADPWAAFPLADAPEAQPAPGGWVNFPPPKPPATPAPVEPTLPVPDQLAWVDAAEVEFTKQAAATPGLSDAGRQALRTRLYRQHANAAHSSPASMGTGVRLRPITTPMTPPPPPVQGPPSPADVAAETRRAALEKQYGMEGANHPVETLAELYLGKLPPVASALPEEQERQRAAQAEWLRRNETPPEFMNVPGFREKLAAKARPGAVQLPADAALGQAVIDKPKATFARTAAGLADLIANNPEAFAFRLRGRPQPQAPRGRDAGSRQTA